MGWIAIASTVDNIVIAAHDDMNVLEQISEKDFSIIVKIYGLSDAEISNLKEGRLDYRIRFNNLRSTYLEKFNRSSAAAEMSTIYQKRLQIFTAMKGRFEHALNKHRSVLSHQSEIYQCKYNEAKEISSGNPIKDGFVSDYAEEVGLDLESAANLILQKHDDRLQHLRKIERLRIRHFNSLKECRTTEDFARLTSELDKDFFINMLM